MNVNVKEPRTPDAGVTMHPSLPAVAKIKADVKNIRYKYRYQIALNPGHAKKAYGS